MKNSYFVFFAAMLFSCSTDNGNSVDSVDSDDSDIPDSIDLIVGTWTESGQGTVSNDGTNQFSEYDYFCVTLGRFTFNEEGAFSIETFDGPDDECFSTGVITGTWDNEVESYLIKILTDTSDDSQAGQQANIKIEFPDSNRMQWIFPSNSEGIDYSYEEYVRVE